VQPHTRPPHRPLIGASAGPTPLPPRPRLMPQPSPNDPDQDGNALIGARNAALFPLGILALVMLFRWLS
jgi:hypothetical protein